MYPSIDIDTLTAKMADEDVMLLDVREKMAFDAKHIAGAISSPLPGLPEKLAQMPKNQTYHIICRSGNRSARACEFLASQGYDVVNVTGGMLAYLAKEADNK